MALYYDTLEVGLPPFVGGNRTLVGLRDVTVILGRNGSGKSTLLRNLHGQHRDRYHYSSPERAGDLSFDPNFAQTEFDITARGQTRANKNAAASYRRESITRLSTVLTKIGVRASKGREIPPLARVTEDMLSELLPNFAFRITEDKPPFITGYRLSPDGGQEEIPNLTDALSSGETEALTVALDLLTVASMWQLEIEPGEPRLLLVDEPDPHLHPDLQVRFARFLLRLSDELACQVLIATHSTTLTGALGALGGDKAAIAYMTAEPEVKAQEFTGAVQRLVNALGGHALVAPLLGARLLLVEGIDDYTVWSHVPRVPEYTDLFAILPAGGDQIREHQMALESLFASMRDADLPPAGFAMVDGDKNVPTDVPTDHIKFIKLACHEIENLYITDELLKKLGTTWDELAPQLAARARAGEFGAKADWVLAVAEGGDRSTADLKNIMLEIVTVADPVTVPWQVRVGQVLGRGRPAGQLAEFLGEEVVQALWGDAPVEPPDVATA